MDTTKLNLLLEAIDEIKRLEDNRLEDEGYILEEGVGEAAAVFGLSLATICGVALLVGKVDKEINKKRAKTNYHKYMVERKKSRDEIKKNLKYTLSEFDIYGGLKTTASNIENSDKVSMKVRQGINKAITAFNVQVSKCTNQVMKMKSSIDDIEDIYDITHEFEDTIWDIVNPLSDAEWVKETNPKNIIQQIMSVYDNLSTLDTAIRSICNDEEVQYYATREMYFHFYDLCSAIKVSGLKHPELERFDKKTKRSKEYQEYDKYYNKKK